MFKEELPPPPQKKQNKTTQLSLLQGWMWTGGEVSETLGEGDLTA